MKSKTKLTISLDLGASASKGIYSIKDQDDPSTERTETIVMEPEIARIPINLLKEKNNFGVRPENAAWISYRARDKEGVAVGTVAKKYVLPGEQIESVKYQFASDKCMAFIGAIATKHELKGTELDITLNLLIPSDEKQSKEALESNLKKRLRSFYFRGEAIICKLNEFNLHIEGIGGILYRLEKSRQKEELCDEKTIVVLMLGHRNCSYLIFDKGGFSYDSERLGYFDYIQSIKERSIGQRIEDLEYVIPRMEQDPERREFWITHLTSRGENCDREREQSVLEDAIEIAKELHWQKVSRWIDAKIPERMDEILIIGGASRSLYKELSQKFDWMNTVDWGDELSISLKELGVEKAMLHRFTDVFGLHRQYLPA